MQIRVSDKLVKPLTDHAEKEYTSPTAEANKAIEKHLVEHRALLKSGVKLPAGKRRARK